MFSRKEYAFIDINEEDVENLQIPTDIASYISSVTSETLKFPVFTASFDKVVQQCREHQCVGIIGPKGCGKTFTLVALFVLCFTKLNCLFLTPVTLASSCYLSSQNYIKEFITKSKNLDDDNREEIIDALKKKDIVGALQLLVQKYNGLESLIVFVDFSNLADQNMDMVRILHQFSTRARMIASFCSGATHFTIDNSYDNRLFHKLYGDLSKVEITPGFTIDQASRFLSKISSPVELHDINHISATNPYMLSLIKNIPNNNDPISTKVSSYKTIAKFQVSDWLGRNLKLLNQNCSSLREFFC